MSPCCLAASFLRLLVTPSTAARQAPLSRGFSRQEYWTGLPFPPPGDLPNPGIEPSSPALAGGFFFTAEPPGSFQDPDGSEPGLCSRVWILLHQLPAGMPCIHFFSCYWSIIVLQRVSFCCTAKWISSVYTYIPSFPGSHLGHHRALCSLIPSLSLVFCFLIYEIRNNIYFKGLL